MRWAEFRRLGWLAVALFCVGSVAGAAAAPLIVRPVFRATVAVQVVQGLPSNRILLLDWTGQRQLEDEARTLADVVDTRSVISAVIVRRHLPLTVPELASKISTDVPPNSTSISVRVTDPDRRTAVTLAREVTGRFAAVARSMLRAAWTGVRIAISHRTSVLRVEPSRVLAALVGAVCGLISTALIALIRRRTLPPGSGTRTA